jgi:hypothetical protein
MEDAIVESLKSLKWAIICGSSDITQRRVIWMDYLASLNRKGLISEAEISLVENMIELQNKPEK